MSGKAEHDAHGVSLGAAWQPHDHASFIRTVPMQHVQSPYAEHEPHNTSVNQLASMQHVLPEKAWLQQLKASAFVPLISLSPQSSSSSVVGDVSDCKLACETS